MFVANYITELTQSNGISSLRETAKQSQISKTPSSWVSPDLNQKSEKSNFLSPNLVFIDSQIDNYQFLISGIYAGTNIVVIPENKDGIEVITTNIEKYTNSCQKLDAIHIFSHGSPGSLKLGNIFLNQDTIKLYENQIQKWQTALNKTADILLYGCNVAVGIGKNFIQKLHQLTQANIAASLNLIGAAPGNWKLEFATAKITTPQVLKPETMAGYHGTFNSNTVNSITGDRSDNLLKGTLDNDLINGLSGNDTLKGATGDDTLNGGGGKDRVNGNVGNDKLNGNGGDDRLNGGDGNDTVNGGDGNDFINGNGGNDFLTGRQGNDIIKGGSGKDTINGGSGKDIINGNRGNDSLIGGRGDDFLIGGKGNDILKGGSGRDVLNGEQGTDTLIGGSSSDRFVFDIGSQFNLTDMGSDIITDFNNAELDKIVLDKDTFISLSSAVGDGFSVAEEFAVVDSNAAAATSSAKIVYNAANGQLFYNSDGTTDGFGDGGLFATLENQANLQAEDFVLTSNSTPTPAPTPTPDPDPTPTPTPAPTPGPEPIPADITSEVIKFTPSNTEAEIAAQGGPSIEIGTQTIYIGTWQKSSNNQDPIIASFDDTNPDNNWLRTDYETTGADGRGQGLFWDGDDLYVVFTTDGTQGDASEDFRRAASDATQSWLRSYGQGGGRKVSVVARIDEVTGEMTDAAFFSALLSSGDSNTLTVTDLYINSGNNLVVEASSFFSPRNPDGSRMTQVDTNLGSPFDYTLEITQSLDEVISTAAVGWE
ncbi:DUF4347 domain-containing protein [Okeania sp.]|uniref:DUF4347 domain-containing protein n=1 Tax=Okeania sp. TaxID=3100323 RepID=UPI002B4B91ED|nr:DUF4347 domain-containing protein [Okeania sp.]MEB3341398.1 DUF4347 domain-containing protein [Okeania sp.]